MKLTTIFRLVLIRGNQKKGLTTDSHFLSNTNNYIRNICISIVLLFLTGCDNFSLIDAKAINDGLNAFLSNKDSPLIKSISSSIAESIDRNYENTNKDTQDLQDQLKEQTLTASSDPDNNANQVPFLLEYYSYDNIAKLNTETAKDLYSVLETNRQITSIYSSVPDSFISSPINSLLNLAGQTLPREVKLPTFTIVSGQPSNTISPGLLILGQEDKNHMKLNFYSKVIPDLKVTKPYLSYVGNSLLFVQRDILSTSSAVIDFKATLAPNALIGIFRTRDQNLKTQLNGFSAGVSSSSKLNDASKNISLTYKVVTTSPIYLNNVSMSVINQTDIEKTSFATFATSNNSITLNSFEITFQNDVVFAPVQDQSLNYFKTTIALANGKTIVSQSINFLTIANSDLIIRHAKISGLAENSVIEGSIALQFYGKQLDTLAGLINISSRTSSSSNIYWIFGPFIMEKSK